MSPSDRVLLPGSHTGEIVAKVVWSNRKIDKGERKENHDPDAYNSRSAAACVVHPAV